MRKRKLTLRELELLEALKCAYLNCKKLTPEAEEYIKLTIEKFN